MIYIKNNTEQQTIYIPKDGDGVYIPSGGGSYNQGFIDGKAWQKAKLTSETFTENGDYFREDGWNEITIAVPQGDYAEGYADGYASGVTHTKDQMTDLSVTANNVTYSSETGYKSVRVLIDMSGGFTTSATTNGHYEYSAHDFGVAGWETVEIDVDVPTDLYYNSGYTDGRNYQKSLLSSATITSAGTYTSENGWSSITVSDVIGIGEIGVTCVYDTSITHVTKNLVGGHGSGWYVQEINGVFDSIGAPVSAISSALTVNYYTTNNNTAIDDLGSYDYLRSVVFRDNTTVMSPFMFQGSAHLTSVTLSNSVITIPNRCFGRCGFDSISIPSAVTSIQEGAFQDCSSLTSITCYATTAPSIYYPFMGDFPETGVLTIPRGSDYSSWLYREEPHQTGNMLPSGWTVSYILDEMTT